MNFAQPSFVSSYWTSTLPNTCFAQFVSPPSEVLLCLVCVPTRSWISCWRLHEFHIDSSKGRSCWIQGFKLDLLLLRSSSCTSGSLAELSTRKDKCLWYGPCMASRKQRANQDNLWRGYSMYIFDERVCVCIWTWQDWSWGQATGSFQMCSKDHVGGGFQCHHWLGCWCHLGFLEEIRSEERYCCTSTCSMNTLQGLERSDEVPALARSQNQNPSNTHTHTW